MHPDTVDMLLLLLSLVAPPPPVVPLPWLDGSFGAAFQSERESVFAWRAMRSGKILPLKEIERRVVPTMKDAQYIGVSLDTEAAIYTLKFLRDGAVIWVDVDARSGQVVGRTGR